MFQLTGSDRPADNPNQGSLFQRARRYDTQTIDMFASHLPAATGSRPHADTAASTESARLGATAGALLRGARGSLLGLAFASDWIVGRGSALVGKTVTSPADLATLAATLRDPRIETFRYFLVKDNKVVYHTAVSSRLYDSTDFAIGDQGKFLDRVKATMTRLGADGYYIMHNHPSRTMKASDADINVTRYFASDLPGFLGHVVLDHNEFVLIDHNGDTSVEKLSGPEEDQTRATNRPHPVLGTTINSRAAFADIADKVRSKNNVVLVSTDAQLGVVGVMEAHPDQFRKAGFDVLRTIGRLRKASGSNIVFAVLPDSMSLAEIAPALLTKGWFIDAYGKMPGGGTGSASSTRINGAVTGQIRRNKKRKGIAVEQPSATYGQGDLFADMAEAESLEIDKAMQKNSPQMSMFDMLDAGQDAMKKAGVPTAVADSEQQQAIDKHKLPEDTTFEKGKGLAAEKWFARSGKHSSNASSTIDAAAQSLAELIKMEQSRQDSEKNRKALATNVASKLKRGERPTNTELLDLFGLEPHHTYVKQSAVGQFLVEHMGVSRNRIHESLDEAGGYVTSDGGVKYPIVYPRKLHKVFAANRLNDEQDKGAKFSRSARANGAPVSTIRSAIQKAYGKLLDRLEARGLVTLAQTVEDAVDAAAQARARVTGESVEDVKRSLMAGVKNSLSPMKSIDANVRRGREALAKALAEQTTVHRAMFRNGLGWVDFVWGDDKRGLQHIMDRRQQADGMTSAEAVRFLHDRVIWVVAYGEEVRRSEVGGSVRLTIAGDGTQAVLVRQKDSNAWVLTGFELKPDAAGRGATATAATVATPIRSRDSSGAGVASIDDSGLDVKFSTNGDTEGFFDPVSGKSFLIADALTEETAPGTLMHEVGTHMYAEKDGPMQKLIARTGKLRQKWANNKFVQEAEARMREAGETSDEEFLAYTVTQYENNRAGMPVTLVSLVKDFTAAVKAWMFNNGYLQAGKLTVADLAAIARANARKMARGMEAGANAGANTRQSVVQSKEVREFAETERAYGGREAYDRAKADGKTKLGYRQWVQVRTPAFKAWFGDHEIAAATPKRQASTFTEARDQAKEFQGKPLANSATGIVATVSRNNLDKMLNGKAVGKSESPATHSLAVANLDTIFERALLGWSKPDSAGDPNIKAVHRFFSPVMVDGHAMLAKMTVKETAQESRPNSLYTVEAISFEKMEIPTAQWVGEIADADGIDPRTIRSVGMVESLAQRVQDFNPAAVSKVVDPETGEPMVVYHGTEKSGLTVFDLAQARQNADVPSFFFATNREDAESFGQNVIEAFLNIRNPAEKPNANMRGSEVRAELERDGYDGTVVEDDYSTEYAAFRPTQIKSATGNTGAFGGANPDIRFSRTAQVAHVAQSAMEQIDQAMNHPGTVSIWDRTVGTMRNLAERNHEFKPVFDAAQSFIEDVSTLANDAADRAPRILPRLESWRDMTKRPVSAQDNKSVAKHLFEGTLLWTRGADGKPG